MPILSELLGSILNVGGSYLLDRLKQSSLEDMLRQGTNYYTGQLLPQAQEAMGLQKSMLEGGSLPGVGSLLGESGSVPTYQPFGPEAQKRASMVRFAPTIPSDVRPSPFIAEQTAKLAGEVATQPDALIAEHIKQRGEQQKQFTDLLKMGQELMSEPIKAGVPMGIVMRNIGQWASTGGTNPDMLMRDVPPDLQPLILQNLQQREEARALGGLTPEVVGKEIGKAGGMAAATGWAGVGPELAKEKGRLQLKEQYPGVNEKDVPPGIPQAMVKELQNRHPESFKMVPTPTGITYQPNPAMNAIVRKAMALYKGQKARDWYDALNQAEGAMPSAPETNPQKDILKKKGFLK